MNPGAEWLEADGLGGFASGRADGTRTRRYHALLLVATRPPTGRMVLVNDVEAWIESDGERFALSSQRYAPDVTAPDGVTRLVHFTVDPWPTWTYRLPSGAEVVRELVVPRGSPLVAQRWSLRAAGATPKAVLTLRPFLSGRDMHAAHFANDVFDFASSVERAEESTIVRWRPYGSVPGIAATANGAFAPEPHWYRQVQYDEERARGLPFLEDLAAPGVFTFDLTRGPAVLVLTAEGLAGSAPPVRDALRAWDGIAVDERARRSAFATPLHRAAEDYLVRRGAGHTIIAGYPWFSDWGRDTFIALRGLCLATGRLADARDILVEWAGHVSEGMLPNYFPDGGQPAEYNSVDASLWYVIAVHELLRAPGASRVLRAGDGDRMREAVRAIVAGFAGGTRYGIRMDDDALLAAGEPGVQLTWMDAKVGDWVVTPRIGKPVEIQALWINALRIAARDDPAWGDVAVRAQAAFAERFWNPALGCLNDVVDVDHVRGTADDSVRPNQLLAIGGLPWPVLHGARAAGVLAVAERELWTDAGPRSLSPADPRYVSVYEGDMRTRDAAYHQGTVWPWLAGPMVEAWLRVHGDTAATRQAARSRFLEPMLRHLGTASLGGHLAEIADADVPHAARGCPFQAWSVGEALRMAGLLAQD